MTHEQQERENLRLYLDCVEKILSQFPQPSPVVLGEIESKLREIRELVPML